VNAAHDTSRHAVFGEATHHVGLNSIFSRVEAVQVETNLLITGLVLSSSGVSLPPTCPSLVHCVGPTADPHQRDTVGAFTIGGVRDVLRWRGFEGGLGAGVTFYAVPESLKATHGDHPVSFQLFFRLRPPAGSMGRMWNMRMSQPTAGHSMTMDHQ
jgi:hypothetical protein